MSVRAGIRRGVIVGIVDLYMSMSKCASHASRGSNSSVYSSHKAVAEVGAASPTITQDPSSRYGC